MGDIARRPMNRGGGPANTAREAGFTVVGMVVVVSLAALLCVLTLQMTNAGGDRAATLGESFQHRTRARNILRNLARELERTTTESPGFSTSPEGGGVRFSLPERFATEGGLPGLPIGDAQLVNLGGLGNALGSVVGESLGLPMLAGLLGVGGDPYVYGTPITYQVNGEGVLVRIKDGTVTPLMGSCVSLDVEPLAGDERRLVLYLTVIGEGSPRNRFREEVHAALLR